ncbi:MAG: type II secretion system protein, partial [Pseudonocardia sediminis]
MSALVPLLLAAALLLAGARTGRSRLAHLFDNGNETEPADDTVRTRWVVVGALAAAAAVWAVVGGTGGLVTGLGIGAAVVVAARRLAGASLRGSTDTGDLAAAWDLLAVCLRVGLAVPVAVEAAAHRLPGPAGSALRRT